MLTRDEHSMQANFNDELTVLEDKYLRLGIDPDYIVDTYRGSAKESARLWKRRTELEE